MIAVARTPRIVATASLQARLTDIGTPSTAASSDGIVADESVSLADGIGSESGKSDATADAVLLTSVESLSQASIAS